LDLSFGYNLIQTLILYVAPWLIMEFWFY